MNQGRRIYVGNIPFQAAEVHLRDLFAPHGDVYEVHIVSDRDTGRARGFAFVTMDEDGATRAIEHLNDTDFGGRTLVVNQAKERERSTSKGGHDRAERPQRESRR